MFSRPYALAVIAALSAHAAFGQGGWNVRSVTGADLPPGSWREYRTTYLADGREEVARVIFLDYETRDGERYQWIERIVDDDLGGLDPGRHWTVTRSFESIDRPFTPAPERFTQKTYTGEVEQQTSNRPPTKGAISYQPLGSVEVETEAGTFDTRVVDVVRFDLHERPHFSVVHPVGLVFVETPIVRLELTGWGDGESTHVVQTPPPRQPDSSGGFRRGVIESNQGGPDPFGMPGVEFMICIRDYVSHWMVSGDIDDFTEVFDQAGSYCSALGLDRAAPTAEDIEGMFQMMQGIWPSMRSRFQPR